MGKILKSLFGKTILVVGAKSQTFEVVTAAFRGLHCKIVDAKEEEEAIALIHSQASVEAVIVEVDVPISKGFGFLDKIRPLDHARPPVFFLTNRHDPEIDEAFFRGVEAVFIKPVKYEELVRGVEFSHEILMDHDSGRKHVRRRIRRAKVLVTNESTGETLSGYVVNASVGGFFICSMHALPAANQMIRFKMMYEAPVAVGAEPRRLELSGRASVRWLRPNSHYGRPPGFGIEFKELDEKDRELIKILMEE